MVANDSTIAIDIIFASNDDNPEQVLGEISNEQLVEEDSRGRTSVHAACSQACQHFGIYSQQAKSKPRIR